jgi:autotransporter-associated beta strand protein
VNGNIVTTTTADVLNFGHAALGLGAGFIAVNAVDAGDLNFASSSGSIELAGGAINLAAVSTITANNPGNIAHAISCVLAGAGTSLTKNGTGTIILNTANLYTGPTKMPPTGKLPPETLENFRKWKSEVGQSPKDSKGAPIVRRSLTLAPAFSFAFARAVNHRAFGRRARNPSTWGSPRAPSVRPLSSVVLNLKTGGRAGNPSTATPSRGVTFHVQDGRGAGSIMPEGTIFPIRAAAVSCPVLARFVTWSHGGSARGPTLLALAFSPGRTGTGAIGRGIPLFFFGGHLTVRELTVRAKFTFPSGKTEAWDLFLLRGRHL